jgi:hypothetical protein
MPPPSQHIPPSQAISLFWSVTFKGWMHRLWARVTRRQARLLDLDETLKSGEITGSRYGGLQPVGIAEIHGTQGKGDAFDDSFFPTGTLTRSRWLSIAKAKLSGKELPPVDLVMVNGVYYVRDGHHRISVSRTLGQDYIDAEVTIIQIQRRVY